MSLHYCTIVARNYLPHAMALWQSLKLQAPQARLSILLLDGAAPDEVRELDGVAVVEAEALFPSIEDFHRLAAIYDVVELATAVKPLFLMHLLKENAAVVYVDPDTYFVSAPLELEHLVVDHPIILTPHFLSPIPPDSAHVSEIHSLTVGVYNLGFIAVNHYAMPFLRWWWSHLENECLIYPLLGLFVDQKWVDVAASYFPTYSLRHAGYNVGPWNVHERPIATGDDDAYRAGEVPLRLFHFSGFDIGDPTELSSRLTASTSTLLKASPALRQLSLQYSKVLGEELARIGVGPGYAFATDSTGRPLTLRVRRAYRSDQLRAGRDKLPSPFSAHDASAFRTWRRKSRALQLRQLLADAAIAGKYVFPEEYRRLRQAMPARTVKWRGQLLDAGRVRR